MPVLTTRDTAPGWPEMPAGPSRATASSPRCSAWSLALTLVAGAIITPLGDEAFFRGLVANALLARYGTWVGVIVSAAILAVAHGINPILPVAFVVLLLAPAVA